MDNKLLFIGGEPNITTDDIMRQQYANTYAIYGMAQGIAAGASNFIISGVEAGAPVSGNVTFSAGYIFLNGEVVQVDPQTVPVLGAGEKYKIEKVVSYESGGDKTFLDGTPRQTWQKNRGVISKVPVATVVELEVTPKQMMKYFNYSTRFAWSWYMSIGRQDIVAVTLPSDFNNVDPAKLRPALTSIFCFIEVTSGTSIQGSIESFKFLTRSGNMTIDIVVSSLNEVAFHTNTVAKASLYITIDSRLITA